MASGLQNKLFRSNPKFISLATLMVTEVYPTLIQLMKELGMVEVRFADVKGYRRCGLTIDGNIEFFDLKDKDEKSAVYTLKVMGETVCPLFTKSENSQTKSFQTAIDSYDAFCNEAINSIEILKQKLANVDSTISRIQNLHQYSQRLVLFEKTEKQ